MEFLSWAVDFVLHLDDHLADIIAQYGTWTYLILFLIILAETGFVGTPFLPGDSLLFAVGTFAGMGVLDPWLLFVLLSIAAIAGDTINYWVGRWVGPRAFSGSIPWLRRDYLDKTQAFYERHGGKTIVLARFVPIVRTFAPFVAGVGRMNYGRFLAYNIGGGIFWVGSLVGAGTLFGNIPWVRDNFGSVVLAIIVISVLPILVEFLKARREKQTSE